MIISTWITKLIAKSGAIFDDVSTDEVREYLNDALILHRRYIRQRANKVYSKKTSLTLAADGYELDLPTDMDDSVTALLKSSEFNPNPVTSLDYQIKRGQIVFTREQSSASVFWIEYTMIPNYYDLTSEDAVELDYPDVKRLLEKEVMASVIKVEDDFESSNAVNNLTVEANLSQQG